MRYSVQTGLEHIEAEFVADAFDQFLKSVREIVVIIEDEDNQIYEMMVSGPIRFGE